MADGLYIFAALSCLYAALQSPWVQRLVGIYHEPAPPVPPPSVPATATASMGAVTFAPVFNNQMGGGGVLVNYDKDILPAAKVVERPKPILISHGIQKVVQTRHNFVFDTRNGDVIYTLRVENSARGASIQGAIASIRFNGKNGLLAMVQRAYWYEERPHEVEFQLNATKDIVLGKCANGRWYHYNNPMRHVPQFGRTPNREPDAPESFALDDSCTMIVEVFNPYRGNDIYILKKKL